MSTGPTGVNSPDRRLTDNGYFCNQYGYIAYDDYGVQYSYGKSPDPARDDNAWRVLPSGSVFGSNYYDVADSYGRSFDRLFQNYIIFMVKITESLHRQQLCVSCEVEWWRRRQLGCQRILRAHYRSPGTNYSSSAWQVNPSGNVNSVSIDDYVDNSYGINHSIVLYGNFRAN